MARTKALSAIMAVVFIIGLLCIIPVFRAVAVNPYLPLWEHLPDGEPRVFEDPDNPGKFRIYIIGSHDVRVDSYCGPDIRVWSAPTDDLTNWRDDGAVFTFQDPETLQWDTMYAPDMVEVLRRDENGDRTIREYYLYPHSRGPGREAMVAKASRPDGPFEPINLRDDGRTLMPGSVMGFDPAVYIEYVDDPNDPDYEVGFRAYGYWGFQRAFAAELDQNTMWSLRPDTQVINYFIPASSSFGNLRDPAGTTYPHIFDDEDLTAFNYFEAFSIRKVGNKYVNIFSGYSGPDYGLSSTNSALRYMFADHPLGPWRSGGVLVDSRAPVLNRDGTSLTTSNSAHNTHGGIEYINGQWYAFYHRPPRGFGNARQPMAAPIHIEWDEKSVADGGRVTIRGFDPFAEDNTWTAKASDGTEYNGAEVTSEGFQIYGLPPYRYYSAGIACYFSNPNTLQDSWDIWDNHMPVTNMSNNHIVGYKYFGFGGLASPTKNLPAFTGTKPGDNTKFNLWLTPKNEHEFKVGVWLDGPWDNDAWNGTKIGEIVVPANSPQETARFTVDVAEYVEHLTQKNAIFLVGEGSGSVDLIGLGFSSDANSIERPIAPTVSIFLDGQPLDLPEFPVRSNSVNGIIGYDYYEVNAILPIDADIITTVTASASNPDVKITVTPLDAVFGTAVVDFDYKGTVKTYGINFLPVSNLSEPRHISIEKSSPVFEGPAKIAWGDVIGFLDAGNPPGAVSFTFNAPEAGINVMSIYHTTPWGAASHIYQINDGEPIVFNYPEGDWLTSPFPQDIELAEGTNTIKITHNQGITELRGIVLQTYLSEEEQQRMITHVPTRQEPEQPDEEPDAEPGAEPDEEPDSNLLIWIIAGAAVVVIGGAVVFFLRVRN
jgi:hypothetical protein